MDKLLLATMEATTAAMQAMQAPTLLQLLQLDLLQLRMALVHNRADKAKDNKAKAMASIIAVVSLFLSSLLLSNAITAGGNGKNRQNRRGRSGRHYGRHH